MKNLNELTNPEFNLEEVVQVYFGLKKGDITYVSAEKGDNGHDGLSPNFPKKTFSNYSTKYIIILDGVHSFGKPASFNGKIIIGVNNKDCKLSFTSDMSASDTLTAINLTISFEKQSINLKSSNITLYNCIFSSRDWRTCFKFYNCCIMPSEYVGNYYNNSTVVNCIGKKLTSWSSSFNIIDTDLSSATDESREDIINTGDTSIVNPDGTRSNIGIYGGPYWFDGWRKNMLIGTADVTINEFENKTDLELNNVNLNPNITKIQNGSSIVQKIFVDKNNALELVDSFSHELDLRRILHTRLENI